MKKNKIRLTESQLHKLVNNIVRKVLSEKKSWSEMSDAERKKDNENWQSWQDLRHKYDNGHGTYYYDQTKGGKGYADEWDIPQEELEMYQSIGNPSQYATKGEQQKSALNKSGYGWHHTPERYDNGNLSIAAQSEPETYRQQSNEFYQDDDEAPVSWVSGSDGKNRVGTTSTYARDINNFRGNQDMHDLESDRINRANYEAEHELDHLNLNESIRRAIRNVLNEGRNDLLGEYLINLIANGAQQLKAFGDINVAKQEIEKRIMSAHLTNEQKKNYLHGNGYDFGGIMGAKNLNQLSQIIAQIGMAFTGYGLKGTGRKKRFK